MEITDKIFVAGHRGLVGSAIVRNLQAKGFTNIVTRDRAQLDLANEATVSEFFATEQPNYVVLAAAKVGGIKANNDHPVEFLLDNLRIQNNIISAAHKNDVRKLLFLGSSCIYPKHAPQPIPENALLTGPLEPTNDAYAIAKIAGIRLCQAYASEYGENFISAMPTNLYGPNDNFDLLSSHVLPALLRKAHEAKMSGAREIMVWGSGKPRREFLHVDDMADACVFLLQNYDSPEIVNVGWGQDTTIRELVEIICDVVGFHGEITFDATKPDGTPRKLLDTSRLTALGWQPKILLRDGVAQTYEWFLAHKATPAVQLNEQAARRRCRCRAHRDQSRAALFGTAAGGVQRNPGDRCREGGAGSQMSTVWPRPLRSPTSRNGSTRRRSRHQRAAISRSRGRSSNAASIC
jgi:GDP-L-fucose synthase